MCDETLNYTSNSAFRHEMEAFIDFCVLYFDTQSFILDMYVYKYLGFWDQIKAFGHNVYKKREKRHNNYPKLISIEFIMKNTALEN